MCNYCGCREFPLVGRLSAEHEAIANAAGRLRTAARAGGADALPALDALSALLIPHTTVEEQGLFAELRAEGSLVEAVEQLCAEHDDIHGVLGGVDRAAPDWPAVLAALRPAAPAHRQRGARALPGRGDRAADPGLGPDHPDHRRMISGPSARLLEVVRRHDDRDVPASGCVPAGRTETWAARRSIRRNEAYVASDRRCGAGAAGGGWAGAPGGGVRRRPDAAPDRRPGGGRLLPGPLVLRQGGALHARGELHRLVLVEGVRQGRHHHLGAAADRLPERRARTGPSTSRAAAPGAPRSPGTPTRPPGCATRTPGACWWRCTGRPRPACGDPVAAWADIQADPERRRRYQRARGKGGLVRVVVGRGAGDGRRRARARDQASTARTGSPASRRSRRCRWCRTRSAPGSCR